MDPSHCTIVVCLQTARQPYAFQPNHYRPVDAHSLYSGLLLSVFGQVHVYTDATAAVDQLKQSRHGSPTLLLLDVDRHSDTVDESDHNDDDDDTVYTPSCSSSYSTASSASAVGGSRIAWISGIARQLDDAMLDDVPVIVCSTNTSSSFMLDCIHAGAADYLLKPLRLDAIKTLFLKLHRCRPDSKMHDASHRAPAFPSLNSCPPTATGPLDDRLKHRLRETFTKDTLFAQSVLHLYTNNTVFHMPHRRLSSDRATQLKHKISSWDFSPFELSQNDLIHCACLMFQQVLDLPALAHVGIKEGQLYDFVSDLSNTYHTENPYHNFAHAVDVLQCLYYFCCRLGLLSFADGRANPIVNNVAQRPQDLFRPKDVFALFIAAIGHDAGHPGVNNQFLISSGAPLALLYNDCSVLENFHAMTLFQVIKKHGFDRIAGGPGSPEYQAFRKTIVSSILATDMTHHNDYVAKIDSQASRLRNINLTDLDPAACEQERLLMCSAMIKCADISNVTRPFRHAATWAELLIEECVCQGDLERAMDLVVIPMNDRDKVELKGSQLGFIRFVARGLFQSVCQVLPDLSFTTDYIVENLVYWENHEPTSQDSGIGSLNDAPGGTPTAEAGNKRRNSSIGCHSHAVQLLRKRLSREDEEKRRNAGEKLAGMSGLSVSNFEPMHHHLELSDDEQDDETSEAWLQSQSRQVPTATTISHPYTIQ